MARFRVVVFPLAKLCCLFAHPRASNKMAAPPCENSALCLVQNHHGAGRGSQLFFFLNVDGPQLCSVAAQRQRNLPIPAFYTCKSQLKHEDELEKYR